ncbi:hypothetical protein YC2023_014474 [Brassica napus]
MEKHGMEIKQRSLGKEEERTKKIEHVAREEKSVGGAAYISTIIFSPLIVVKVMCIRTWQIQWLFSVMRSTVILLGVKAFSCGDK